MCVGLPALNPVYCPVVPDTGPWSLRSTSLRRRFRYRIPGFVPLDPWLVVPAGSMDNCTRSIIARSRLALSTSSYRSTSPVTRSRWYWTISALVVPTFTRSISCSAVTVMLQPPVFAFQDRGPGLRPALTKPLIRRRIPDACSGFRLRFAKTIGLAHAGRSQQQDVAGLGDEGQAGQFSDLLLVDGGLEGELLQGAVRYRYHHGFPAGPVTPGTGPPLRQDEALPRPLHPGCTAIRSWPPRPPLCPTAVPPVPSRHRPAKSPASPGKIP